MDNNDRIPSPNPPTKPKLKGDQTNQIAELKRHLQKVQQESNQQAKEIQRLKHSKGKDDDERVPDSEVDPAVDKQLAKINSELADYEHKLANCDPDDKDSLQAMVDRRRTKKKDLEDRRDASKPKSSRLQRAENALKQAKARVAATKKEVEAQQDEVAKAIELLYDLRADLAKVQAEQDKAQNDLDELDAAAPPPPSPSPQLMGLEGILAKLKADRTEENAAIYDPMVEEYSKKLQEERKRAMEEAQKAKQEKEKARQQKETEDAASAAQGAGGTESTTTAPQPARASSRRTSAYVAAEVKMDDAEATKVGEQGRAAADDPGDVADGMSADMARWFKARPERGEVETDDSFKAREGDWFEQIPSRQKKARQDMRQG